ncbi:DUF3795 domain-containing protein [Candidatus Bathyarchaeota archaeon]|nr:DUF3795 domain-containing protein [Candidatus Bathyarchaeota archaeon]
MKAEYPEIGVCGLSCRLCPAHHRETVSKCEGCKTQSRMTVGCALSNCAIKKKSAEFCWLCGEEKTCVRWKRHRELGKQHDSFVSYIRLEDNISSVQEHGVEEFEKQQKRRESLLITMLKEYNEGRSKTYYCIAASVLDVPDLEASLEEARKQAGNLETKEKAIVLHGILDRFAARKKCYLKLRK